MALTVGQKLWFVPDNRHRAAPHEVTILKVGRVWLSIDGRARVNIKTMRTDGWPDGRCYLSMEDYRKEALRQEAWIGLGTRFRHSWMGPAAGVTLEDIQAAELKLFPRGRE